MKTKNLLFVLALLMCTTSMHSQFLRKLKNKLEQVTEDVVINKTSEKAGQSLDKTLDNILGLDGASYDGNIGDISFGSISVGDPALLPDSYTFEWKYRLLIEGSSSDPMEIIYYLKPDEKYFGMQPQLEEIKKNQDMFMVMDVENNLNAIFMTNKKTKTGMVMKTNNTLDNLNTDESLENDYTFTEIEDKVINGKTCKGFRMENKDAVMTMYNDMNAPVSFVSIFGINTKNAPKGFNPKWLNKVENSMVMEINYTNKSNNESTTMRCLELVEQHLEIRKNDYEFTAFGQ
ncbi:conserved hypothetical protein [Formosa agariphila KMM 3901]|uniref:DUF4412 domain-containing protein n=1 Tax=Formosa agariphila (strain DSM 15362 / KCTC 12365 / LMG 23005 / KMM 3901 / M-2Alg 35-1) TaxID=1347342 RepID=T2KKP7_FORAG|nr:DUF4412 domain-containing protein [Formosa agariphila]CDF79001.1 conserved hypothetical protein [Formosa agariphila KMM 3901]